jgi:hypothetical protein
MTRRRGRSRVYAPALMPITVRGRVAVATRTRSRRYDREPGRPSGRVERRRTAGSASVSRSCHHQFRRPANGNLWSSGRQDDFAGGSCSAVPPARPGRHGAPSAFIAPVGCWLASARIVLSPAGPAGAAQVVAGAGFRLPVGGECLPGGQVGVCGGEVICSGMPAQAGRNSRPAGSWPISLS